MEPIFNAQTQKKLLEDFRDNDWSMTPFESLKDRGISSRHLDEVVEHLVSGAWIAGGAVESIAREEPIKDIDIFCANEDAFWNVIDSLTRYEDGYTLKHTKEELELVSNRFALLQKKNAPDIQVIKTMWYPSLKHVLHSFDFTATQVGIQKEEGGLKVVSNPMAFFDIARKRLVLWRMTFPASTIRRMIKYTQKGYYACAGALETIATETKTALEQNPQAQEFIYVD